MPRDRQSTQTLVIGDVNVDLVVAPVTKSGGDRKWRKELQYCEFRRPGGAWLAHEIISGAIGEDGEVLSYSQEAAKKWCSEVRPPCLVSIASLKEYVRDPEEKPLRKVFRMDRAILGWLRTHGGEFAKEDMEHTAVLGELLDEVKHRAHHPPLIVIYDHNNGFRDLDPARSISPFIKGNPHFLPERHPKMSPRGIILWHPDHPICSGNVWEYLSTHHPTQTVAVVHAEDLREHGIFLKEDLSLEQTAQHFLDQLNYSPLKDLGGLACVVVRFSNAVMVYSGAGIAGKGESMFLSFLPHAHRGGSSQSGEHGSIVGYTLLLLGGIARGIQWALSRASGASDEQWLELLEQGIRGGTELGLAYGQVHFREGFLAADFEESGVGEPSPYRTLVQGFSERITRDKRMRNEVQLTSLRFEPDELRRNPSWSRVAVLGNGAELIASAIDIVRWGLADVLEYTSEEKAGTFVRECSVDEQLMQTGEGTELHWNATRESDPEPHAEGGSTSAGEMEKPAPWGVLKQRLRFPYFQVGKLSLVDRQEIDAFEGLGTLIRNYLRTDDWKEPLCIAVFGPPGSGKSFAVKELLTKAGHGKPVEPLEFNIAQFRDFHDLAKAFHVVQDKGLRDPVPFVFFDEFDSNYGKDRLGWLKYFLAPMQDGTFRDGETTYRVGRAIFFFAGGTNATFEEFSNPQKETAHDELMHAKLPDFVSRLRGYLNVSGINAGSSEVDDLTIIRRAILLRAFIEKNCRSIIDQRTKRAKINPDVVRAFLLTKRFKHGVRSMEAIVEMAGISLSRASFQKSSVPLDSQLAMHVDPDDFLSHIQAVTDAWKEVE